MAAIRSMDKGVSFFSNFIYSLFIHAILLSFLLTMPIYHEEGGNKSLWGYFVYLAGGDETQMKLSADDGVSKNQSFVGQEQGQAMFSEKVIDEVMTEEKKVPSVGTLKAARNENVSSENYMVEDMVQPKETQMVASEEPGVAKLPPPDIEEKKSLDKAEDDVEIHETAVMDKDIPIDMGADKSEKPPLTERAQAIKEDRKSSSISTPGENISELTRQRELPDKVPAPKIKADEADVVKKEEILPEIPKISDSPGETKKAVQREKTGQKSLREGPEPEISSERAEGISLLPPLQENKKEVVTELPPATEKAPEMTAMVKTPEPPRVTEGKSEPPAPSIRTQETVAVKKEENVLKSPKEIDVASVPDKTVQMEKPVKNLKQDGFGSKILSEKSEKVSLLPDIENRIREARLNLPPKNAKTTEMNARAKISKPLRVAGGANEPHALPEESDTAKKMEQKGRPHKNMQKDAGGNIPGAKRNEVLILPEIEDIIKGTPAGSYVETEKSMGMNGEALISRSPLVSGGPEGPPGNAEKSGADVGNAKGTENEDKAAGAKDHVEKVPGSDAEKSSIGLSMDESLFYKDIKIEVLLKDMAHSRVDMYLLKTSYSSLRKRHKWGPEQKIGTTVQTIQKGGTDKDMMRVLSVAKGSEGIYTFVIDNRDVNPFETEVLFTLYGGQSRKRDKTYKTVIIPPASVRHFKFVLPDAVFWDDEDHFTGSIEDSDSITKFNDESQFLWREEKDY